MDKFIALLVLLVSLYVIGYNMGQSAGTKPAFDRGVAVTTNLNQIEGHQWVEKELAKRTMTQNNGVAWEESYK